MNKKFLRKIAILCGVSVLTAFGVFGCGKKEEVPADETAEATSGAEAEAQAESLTAQGHTVAGSTVEGDTAAGDAAAGSAAAEETAGAEEPTAAAEASGAEGSVDHIVPKPDEIDEQIKEEFLNEISGEMDLEGAWEDEVSQRAHMNVTKNEDGSYNIVVRWGSSAFETSVWEIHGTYDEVSGMLSYQDGAYSIHTADEKGNETISGEETTNGAFMKEGEKLRWSDSKAPDDGLFVKQ